MIFRPNRFIVLLAGLFALAAGSSWSDAAAQPEVDPGAPLSSMVAVAFRDPGPTTADNLFDYLKQYPGLSLGATLAFANCRATFFILPWSNARFRQSRSGNQGAETMRRTASSTNKWKRA